MRFSCITRRTLSLLSLVAAFLPASAAGASPSIWSQPLGAIVELEGPTTLRGPTPLPLAERPSGFYHVRAQCAGHESAFGVLSLRFRDGRMELGEGSRGLRRERVRRSLLFPGHGQMMEGRKLPGFIWSTLALGTGALAVWTQLEYADAHDAHQASEVRLNVGREEEGYLDRLDDAFHLEAEAKARRRDRDAALLAVGGVWAFNLIDAALFHGSFRVREASDGVVQIHLTPKTRARTIVRSLLFPGLGQNYAGQNFRAVLFASAATAAGFLTALYHLDYKEELDRIDALAREWAELTPGGPPEAALSEKLAAEQEEAALRRDDKEEQRNIVAIITAAIWVGSVLDAALFEPTGGVTEPASAEVGLLSTPIERAPALGLRLRF